MPVACGHCAGPPYAPREPAPRMGGESRSVPVARDLALHPRFPSARDGSVPCPSWGDVLAACDPDGTGIVLVASFVIVQRLDRIGEDVTGHGLAELAPVFAGGPEVDAGE